MPATQMPHDRRELAHRSSSGVDVHLFWNPTTDSLVVDVRDLRGPLFELVAPHDKALDVFDHPFAYWRLREAQAPKEAPSCR